ncbi:MAG: TetR/AcrR family transcriptional regulator [Ignavibacteriales bacterium]|nr:MAG: TetR/AcrR family transcriptional regulator [Ignavibacteriales bacterium]
MEDSILSRKERERIFRRKEIMDAAVKYFAEKGFSATTLEEIAGSAEFGKGTLYNYFQGKEEIYRAIIDDVIQNNEEIIKKADSNSETFIEFIEKYTKGLFEYCLQNKYSVHLFIREIARLDRHYEDMTHQDLLQKHSQIKELLAKRINIGLKNKEIKEFDLQKLVVLYNHMVFPYINHLIICPHPDADAGVEANFILSILFDGIRNNHK